MQLKDFKNITNSPKILMKNKNILIFYPHNIFSQKNGINNRYMNLLKYFKSRGISVDIFTLSGNPGIKSVWKEFDLISEVFVYRRRNVELIEFLKKIYTKLKKIIFRTEYFTMPDLAKKGMKSEFKRIASAKIYDSVLISYANWARLIDDPFYEEKTIVLDLSDFTTHQLYEKSGGKIKIGSVFNEEIDRINLFDKVIAVSESELYLFSSFCDNPDFFSIPIFMREGIRENADPDFDLLIVGSNNPHNIKGLKWFFENIFNLMERSVTIAIAGGLSDFAPDGGNIRKFGRLDDLTELYNRSKIALSPLLSGSGMKVKVVEALSYGLPVVATKFGSAGINHNSQSGIFISDDPDEFKSSIIKLLSNKPFYNKCSDDALQFFKENFSDEIIYKNLDKVFLKRSEINDNGGFV